MAFSETTETIEVVGPDAGGALSLNADEDVTAGQVVKIGSADSCEPSDTDGEVVHGVATQTVSSGAQVQVDSIGSLVKLQAGTGTISAGDKLTSHGGSGEEGQVDTADATGDFIVGMALEGSSAQGDTLLALLTLAGEVN